MKSEQSELVKENKLAGAPLSARWLAAALAACAALLAGVARIDHALPAPLGLAAPPHRFRALVAHQHLVNLTSIGPRVAGSYENEVLAVSLLVSTLRDIAARASPHNRVELDVHSASGAFELSFMDGMNNVYRGVQSVAARVRGAGGRPRARSALLLNCHFDTVPDSPGASDDGAGCAVLLEVLRALAAGAPLRHDAVFLFNGAEENILQASHAFITQHKWARDVRAFINIEACGAGGREVLFQAGPHDPWLVEMYAGAVPHPFASSLAQELFESGLIPADTDFRIFRDFGKLSGVDLAWSSNGYVYHTRLDTPEQVPPAALQRTGDNVLALAHAHRRQRAGARARYVHTYTHTHTRFGTPEQVPPAALQRTGDNVLTLAHAHRRQRAGARARYVHTYTHTHTRFGTPEQVPPAAMQRTGDNVLALAHGTCTHTHARAHTHPRASGLLSSESLESEPDEARQPVFFDVLGLAVVAVRAPAALLLAAAALALALLKVHVNAGAARAALFVARRAWWRAVARAALAGAAALLAGVLAAALPALLLHAAGARLAWYPRAWLLLPLYGAPALAGAWAAAARLWGAPALLRGWRGARAWHDAAALGWAALLLLCALRGLRSGFLPALWVLGGALADLLAGALGAADGRRAALWALGALLPAAQTCYLALGSLNMFVPLMGRAGSSDLPPDVAMAALVAVLGMASCAWLLPLALAARGARTAARLAALACALAALLALSPAGAPYSAARPQRLMLFHTRRTLHPPLAPEPTVEHFYWVPELDANTQRSVDEYVSSEGPAARLGADACARLLYCGAPYYLPVLSLVPRSLAVRAPDAPLVRLEATLTLRRVNSTALMLSAALRGPAHVVLLLAPAAGARVAWSSALGAPREGPAWGARRTYFLALHDARAGAGTADWHVELLLTHAEGLQPPHWADVSLAGHAQAGARAASHAGLLARLPRWAAGTGWGVDLHLYRV
ncbi:hypothetical protein PYW07_005472 [Mythimna separata]|uniref:FXNA-like protease n=1 Tax=Mythimna separata TaxID=271217 RepID=A0AAD8DRY2_MYTSE|nr:hypothetical protein PYW07_005472 [Mythimna separata]